jgi:hypothetical protein
MESNFEKDPRILGVLDRLKLTLGAGAFDIVDHWSSDLIAVGIASPQNHQVLVYIGVFDDGYYAELELPPLTGDDGPYRVAGRYSGLTFDQLAGVATKHLALGLISGRNHSANWGGSSV